MIGLMVQMALSSAVLFSPELAHFPGSYFDASGRISIQRRAMERWPGTTVLVEKWHDPELYRPGRMAILLGAAATHDPVLIPLYQDGITRRSQEIRQAAAYGYHELIGARPPNVTGGVSDEAAAKLGLQMGRMRLTLQRNSLVEVWLHAMLRKEGKAFPGFRGTSVEGRAVECLFAVDRVMTVEDLESLIVAFEITENRTVRLGLMRMIESVTLSRFMDHQTGQRSGLGAHHQETGLKRLEAAIERWRGESCRIDPDRILRDNMAEMGVEIAEPRGPGSVDVWLKVLLVGDPPWWSMAARQLYANGGPWITLSALQSGADWNQDRRERLLEWYGMGDMSVKRAPAVPTRGPSPTVQ